MARGACNREAYSGVGLARHNAAVGAAVYTLFQGRLSALSSATSVAGPLGRALGGPGGRVLLGAAVIAGALHDLGKASPHYPLGRGGAPSYVGHELVGAVIMHGAALSLERAGRLGEALLLELAAWAVARHHSAMRERHPLDASDYTVGQAVSALRRLAGRPECLSQALPGPLRGSWVEESLLKALADLAGGGAIIAGLARQYIGELARSPTWLLRSLGGPPGLGGGRWAAYAWMASGAVIVADILVAGSEGRGTDEGVWPAYAEWWRRELGAGAVRRVEGLARDPQESSEVLRGALEGLSLV